MKFEFEEQTNKEKLQMINTSKVLDRRMRVLFFKEHGKYYTSEEFSIKNPELEITMDPHKEVYDLTTQAEEFVKNYSGYRGMHAIIEFQENDCGYPLMVPASERQ